MTDKRKQLAELISCPVPWSDICGEGEFAQVLRYLWFKTVQTHQHYRESELLRTVDWEPDEYFINEIYGPVEIDSALDWISGWRAFACAEYLGAYSRFSKLRAASAQDRKKHWCRTNMSDDEVAKLSVSSGESQLYPRIKTAYLERVSWRALVEVWFTHEEAYTVDIGDLVDTSVVVSSFQSAFDCQSVRVAMNVGAPVGCTFGNPSSWLLLDYDFSTPIFHAYPIMPNEAQLESYRFHAAL